MFAISIVTAQIQPEGTPFSPHTSLVCNPNEKSLLYLHISVFLAGFTGRWEDLSI
jgi:hypothetical protein